MLKNGFYNVKKSVSKKKKNIIINQDFTENEKNINIDLNIILGIASTLTEKIDFGLFIDEYINKSFIRFAIFD